MIQTRFLIYIGIKINGWKVRNQPIKIQLESTKISDLVVLLLGAGSAVIDNVPLVAASIGMFSIASDEPAWHFIAYAAGTGGSMMIIGSAAGIAVMEKEKITFMW